jgi:hypothetical protein
MVLELDLDLSNSFIRCQDVHPAAVPSHLRSKMVPQGEQWFDRICDCLLHMDNM